MVTKDRRKGIGFRNNLAMTGVRLGVILLLALFFTSCSFYTNLRDNPVFKTGAVTYPQNFSAIYGDESSGCITLIWELVENAGSYEIYRMMSSDDLNITKDYIDSNASLIYNYSIPYTQGKNAALEISCISYGQNIFFIKSVSKNTSKSDYSKEYISFYSNYSYSENLAFKEIRDFNYDFNINNGIYLDITVPGNLQYGNLSVRRRQITDYTTDLYDESWAYDDRYDVYRIYNQSDSSFRKTIFDRYDLKAGSKYQYAFVDNWGNLSGKIATKTAKINGWEFDGIQNVGECSFDGSYMHYAGTGNNEITIPAIEDKNYDFKFEQTYVKAVPWYQVDWVEWDESWGDYYIWDYGWFPSYDSSIQDKDERNRAYFWADNARGIELKLIDYTLFVHFDSDTDFIRHYEPETFNFPQTVCAN